MIDLDIHKNERAKGRYFHKAPNIKDITKAKQLAKSDISKSLNSNETNYIDKEFLVLQLSNIPRNIIRLND